MGQEGQEFYPEDPQPGPSWQRAGWPLIGGAFEDDLTQALDPLAFKAAIKASADKGAPQQDEKALEKAASDSISAMMLNSVLQIISASTAPTPADGRVDRMVIGWM